MPYPASWAALIASHLALSRRVSDTTHLMPKQVTMNALRGGALRGAPIGVSGARVSGWGFKGHPVSFFRFVIGMSPRDSAAGLAF